MVESSWLDKSQLGRDTIESVIGKLKNLAWHLEESGNQKIADNLLDFALELKIGLDDINKSVDQHLDEGVKEAYGNVGKILSKLVDKDEVK